MKERKGFQTKMIREIILVRVGTTPLSARQLREQIARDYGSFCIRQFWRILKELREAHLVSRIGIFRDSHNGGYIYGNHG